MTYRIVHRLLLATIGIAAVAWAQAPQEFEVASIKPGDPAFHGMRIQMAPGGRVSMTNVTLKILIQNAYGVKDFQISGGPGWITSQRYDIVAKAEGDAERPDLKPLMQALLADRFKLTIHRETKELPVYALVVGKNGHKLHASEIQDSPTPGDGPGRGRGNMMRMQRGQLNAEGISLDMLANNLSNQLGRNVIDRTGLKGNFDFKLEWTPEDGQSLGPKEGPESSVASDSAGPSIFTAVQEQLGLKLESSKGPVEMLIIDRVEKATEN